jgi:hypothetical protein
MHPADCRCKKVRLVTQFEGANGSQDLRKESNLSIALTPPFLMDRKACQPRPHQTHSYETTSARFIELRACCPSGTSISHFENLDEPKKKGESASPPVPMACENSQESPMAYRRCPPSTKVEPIWALRLGEGRSRGMAAALLLVRRHPGHRQALGDAGRRDRVR